MIKLINTRSLRSVIRLKLLLSINYLIRIAVLFGISAFGSTSYILYFLQGTQSEKVQIKHLAKYLLYLFNTILVSAGLPQFFCQKSIDLGHKKHACWINHYNEHDAISFLSAYNESEFN